MATRDHTIDHTIIESAKIEFLEHGFEKASLRKIADRAGITTGALYTRYKSKDMLFSSLVTNILTIITIAKENMESNYIEATNECNKSDILNAIHFEENFYINLLKNQYDECILFFCCSEGSSVKRLLDEMLKQKTEATIHYLKSIAKKEIDYNAIEIIMLEQFNYYKRILNKRLSIEETISMLNTVEHFLEQGWQALFNEIL